MANWFQQVAQWALGDSVERVVQDMVVRGQGAPAFWFARGIEVGTHDNLHQPYKYSAWVQSAINKVSGPVASVQPYFFKTNEELAGLRGPSRTRSKFNVRRPLARTPGYSTKRLRYLRAVGEEEIDLPGMEAFLKEPMPGTGYADFIEASVGWYKLAGEIFWLLDDSTLVPFPEEKNKQRPIPQIILARPDRMRQIVEHEKLVGWEYKDANSKAHILLPQQVILIKRYNPYDDWRGLGEYESAKIATEADWLAGKFSRNLMANNGDTGPYIVAKTGIPTDAQREQILNSLRMKREATLRGEFKPVFVTGDITVEDPKVKTVDEAFISVRLENRHEIYIALGVPPSMADVKAAYSIGSASDFYQLITTTCVPTGEKVADGLERLTKRLTGQAVEILFDWDEHPVFQEVRKERLDSLDKLWSKGMALKDASEYLRLELPRVDGDQVGYLPINVVPVSEAMQPPPDPENDPSFAEPGDGAPKETANEDAATKMMREAFEQRAAHRNCLHVEQKAASKNLWLKHMRQRMPAVRMYQSKVSRVINEYRVIALRRLAAAKKSDDGTQWKIAGSEVIAKSLVDLIFDKERFGASLVAQLDPITRTVLQTAGEELMTEIGRKDDPWEMPSADVLKFINRRDKKIRGVGETVRSQINTALANAYEEGATTSDMADAVRGVFNNLSKGEALRIANTETAAAYGFSRHEAMSSAGIQYKTWLSSHGPNVRPAHMQAEIEYSENPIPIDEPFIVNGEALDYPGDDAGSAENVINCQCVQLAAAAPGEDE